MTLPSPAVPPAAAAAALAAADTRHDGARRRALAATRASAALVALLALAACGGGGGGSTAAPPDTPPAPPTAPTPPPPPPPPSPPPSPPPAPAPAPAPPSGAVADEVLVLFAPGVGDAGAVALAAERGLVPISRFGRRPIVRYRIPAGTSRGDLIDALLLDPRVRAAEANAETETPEGRYAVPWALGDGDGGAPTPWAAEALRLAAAQGVSAGEGVRVAVLDGGFDLAHPVLAPRWQRRGDGSITGRDFVDDDADPSETAAPTDTGYGHGTHVAGIVAQAAPAARLMPLRVLDDAGRGNLWVLAEALLWALDPDGDPATDDGAHVVNISLGTTQRSRVLDTVIELANCELAASDDDDDDAEDEYDDGGYDDDRARCAGRRVALVVAAAGNAGNDSERQYPAAEDEYGLLAVTATAPGGGLADFSNRGSWVQLAAPGAAILSSFPGGRAASWSGTSMATPWASGIAALVFATPGPDAAAGVPLPRGWTPEDVRRRLLERARPVCGSGIPALDALAAVTDTNAPAPGC